MELTILGCGGTWPGAGGATSGYLVQHEGFNLLMDCGSGTLSRLQEQITLADIDAVLISHGHPDHFVDLYPLFYARHYGGQGDPGLPVHTPVGFFEIMAQLVSNDSRDVVKVAYDLQEQEPGASLEVGPFRIGVHEMSHIGVEAVGFRVEADDAVLAYTGDSGPCDELTSLAAGADVFLAEATWQNHQELLPFHLSAGQAGEYATKTAVGELVLTHIWPSLDLEVSSAEAAETYDGEIKLAREGLHVKVGG